MNDADQIITLAKVWRFADHDAAELLPALVNVLNGNSNAKPDAQVGSVHDQRVATTVVTKVATTDATSASEIRSDQWQLCWLNNSDTPIIGLLPKVSWTLYPLSTHQLTEPQSVTASDFPLEVVKRLRIESLSHIEISCHRHRLSYADWITELIDYSAAHHPNPHHRQQSTPSNPSYQHGLMGFIGYDIAAKQLSPDCPDIAFAGNTFNATSLSKGEFLGTPCAFLGHYDITLRPTNQGWQLCVHRDTEPTTIEYINQRLNQLEHQLSLPANDNSCSLPTCLLNNTWNYRQYRAAFEQTQRYLRQGDCYQINLTQNWQGKLSASTGTAQRYRLLAYLPKLNANTHAPFAGYLGLAEFELLSCSPELFFVFETASDGSHSIQTKPIKGTRPRGSTPKEDADFKSALADSDKDRAENVMIVDLLRNDLGKFAQTGTVKVPKLFAIESFSNVHHMVSTITATIQEEVHPLTVLFDSLPAGSITGTPKKRAIEIIGELESAPRGAYCGTLGYMNFDGSGQWNVLIRTLQATINQDNVTQVNLWAGGGITVGSDCESEYQECLDKVGNLLAVLAGQQPI